MVAPLVLGLPRGGVAVAAQVSAVLGSPFDVLLVRKLGVPGHAELAFGALASGGVRVLDDELVAAIASLDAATIEAVTARERVELARREAAYRGGRPPLELAGRTAVLVDDGIATGATMRAAVEAVRTEASRVIAAAPVASERAVALLASAADEVVTVHVPARFSSVGAHYRVFDQLNDDDVRRLLGR